MKKFWEWLKKDEKKVINFNKKKQTVKKMDKICYNCKKKRFEDKYTKNKKFPKVKDHCHYIGECKCLTTRWF